MHTLVCHQSSKIETLGSNNGLRGFTQNTEELLEKFRELESITLISKEGVKICFPNKGGQTF